LLQFNEFYCHSPDGTNAFIAEYLIGDHISGFGSCCDFIDHAAYVRIRVLSMVNFGLGLLKLNEIKYA